MKKIRTRTKRFIQAVLVLVPLAFLGYRLAESWQSVRNYDWQFDGWRGLVATVLLLVGFTLLPYATRHVLGALGHDINYRTAYRGYFLAQLSKYLPGGFWVIPGRVVTFAASGISALASGGGVVIELYLLLLAGTGLFLPYLLFFDTLALYWSVIVIVLIVPLFFLIGRSARGAWLVQRIPVDLQQYARALNRLRLGRLLPILLIDLLFWLVVGTAFFWLITTVHPLSAEYWLLSVSAFSMAWVIGFLAFLTPGGLGVREGALALLLTPILPQPMPAVVALLARLWWTLADLISVAIALLLARADTTRGHG